MSADEGEGSRLIEWCFAVACFSSRRYVKRAALHWGYGRLNYVSGKTGIVMKRIKKSRLGR